MSKLNCKTNTKFRVYWNKKEDISLLTAINVHGPKNWTLISDFVKTRDPKQCRERWLTKLNPNVKHGVLTDREIEIVLKTQKKIGNRWSEISKLLPGRSQSQIKNYWYYSRRCENSLETKANNQKDLIFVSVNHTPRPQTGGDEKDKRHNKRKLDKSVGSSSQFIWESTEDMYNRPTKKRRIEINSSSNINYSLETPNSPYTGSLIDDETHRRIAQHDFFEIIGALISLSDVVPPAGDRG
jgi:hypothetical protein